VNTDTTALYSKFTLAMAAATLLASGCVNPETSQQSTQEFKQTNSVSTDNSNDLTETASITVDVINVNEARESDLLREVMSEVNDIYQQCRITMTFNTQNTALASEQSIDSEIRSTMAQQFKKTSPTIFFVQRTIEEDVAYAHLPSLNLPVASTIWITDRVNEGCLAWITAHEIGHVLLDSGKHSSGRVNVMSTGCTLNNWNSGTSAPIWTTEQCSALHLSPFLAR